MDENTGCARRRGRDRLMLRLHNIRDRQRSDPACDQPHQPAPLLPSCRTADEFALKDRPLLCGRDRDTPPRPLALPHTVNVTQDLGGCTEYLPDKVFLRVTEAYYLVVHI